MGALNKVQIIGNLGRDPEITVLNSGSKIAKFSVGVTESYKDKSGARKSNTEWFNIELWGTLADIADKYLTKGSQVYIEGKLKTETWETQSGEKRSKAVMVGLSLQMLGSKPKDSSTAPNKPSRNEDDLPF